MTSGRSPRGRHAFGTLLRAAAVTLLGTPATLLLTAGAAAAVNRDDGDQPGSPISVGAALLIYVGIPLLLFVAVALLVYAPTIARGPRYRPGLTWFAAPVWLNGPDGGTSAVDALPQSLPSRSGGGASARW